MLIAIEGVDGMDVGEKLSGPFEQPETGGHTGVPALRTVGRRHHLAEALHGEHISASSVHWRRCPRSTALARSTIQGCVAATTW